MALAALALVGAGLGGWTFYLEPSRLLTREYALALPGWPAACAGLRVAVLADLHVGSPWNGLARLETVVERTQQAAPDLVLLAGDYMIQGVVGGRQTLPEAFAPVLGRLTAPRACTPCSATTTGGSTGRACRPRSSPRRSRCSKIAPSRSGEATAPSGSPA